MSELLEITSVADLNKLGVACLVAHFGGLESVAETIGAMTKAKQITNIVAYDLMESIQAAVKRYDVANLMPPEPPKVAVKPEARIGRPPKPQAAGLEAYQPRELIAQLRKWGYKGELQYTQTIKV